MNDCTPMSSKSGWFSILTFQGLVIFGAFHDLERYYRVLILHAQCSATLIKKNLGVITVVAIGNLDV